MVLIEWNLVLTARTTLGKTAQLHHLRKQLIGARRFFLKEYSLMTKVKLLTAKKFRRIRWISGIPMTCKLLFLGYSWTFSYSHWSELLMQATNNCWGGYGGQCSDWTRELLAQQQITTGASHQVERVTAEVIAHSSSFLMYFLLVLCRAKCWESTRNQGWSHCETSSVIWKQK